MINPLYLLFYFILSLSLFISTSEAAKICYFSLNNKKEFVEMDKFLKKLNKHTKEPIQIVEYVTQGSSAEKSFKDMVDSGVKCDGLVISGHHTGSFGGENASSTTLSIDFMENLACSPENKNFFSHIKALWLQGCRTLGVGKIETIDTADAHTDRVGAVLVEDHLTQSFAQLNMEFSSTLDQDNPLSSRYLRVFPRATTFGWTKTAPGEKSNSEFSIPYHIAHIATLNDDRKKYFDNPVSGELSLNSAVKYLDAINKVLGTNVINDCGIQRDESHFLEAWKRHGSSGKGYKYAYNNPDLIAYNSLFAGDDQFLKTAKEYDCLLKNSLSKKDYLPVVDNILKNESLIGYSFNSIYELLQRLKKDDDFEGLEILKNKLKQSELLNLFLMRKLSSKELGVLRKVDYYAFWKELTGNSNDSIEKLLQKTCMDMMLKPLPVGANPYDVRDFKETLTQSLAKHGLLNKDVLLLIVDSTKADSYSLSSVASAIRDSKTPIEGAGQILQTIVTSSKANSDALSSVSVAIRYSKTPIEGAGQILQTIATSSKADSNSLNFVAQAISDSKTPIESAGKILQTIVSSPKADSASLNAVAHAIRDSKTPIEGAGKILQTIVSSSKPDSASLKSVASAIGNSKTPIEGAGKILQTIVTSSKADSYSLKSVAHAIGNSKTPIEGAGKILQTIVSSPKADSASLNEVAHAIRDSKIPIEGADKMLQNIERLIDKISK